MSNVFTDYFSVQTFLIVLRETLELAIIISVLLSFVNQSIFPKQHDNGPCADVRKGGALEVGLDCEETEHLIETEQLEQESERLTLEQRGWEHKMRTYGMLRTQIWAGGVLGICVCLVVGAAILAIFYRLGHDVWASTEHVWEGTFSIIASLIISVMGVKILRVNKMQRKWKQKLYGVIQKSKSLRRSIGGPSSGASGELDPEALAEGADKMVLSEKYAMFLLPFITTMREGLEAIVFVGGIGLNEDTLAIAVLVSSVAALVVGTAIGLVLYRLGNTLSLQWFLIVSTGFLYLVAAGLFSKGVWQFELNWFIKKCGGLDVSETGDGPGSYDIKNSVWHVNCCNGEVQDDGAFWMLFTAILGWTNSATYGSVISYNVYWIAVIAAFNYLMYRESEAAGRTSYPRPLVARTAAAFHCWVTLLRTACRPKHTTSSAGAALRDSMDSVDSRTPLAAASGTA